MKETFEQWEKEITTCPLVQGLFRNDDDVMVARKSVVNDLTESGGLLYDVLVGHVVKEDYIHVPRLRDIEDTVKAFAVEMTKFDGESPIVTSAGDLGLPHGGFRLEEGDLVSLFSGGPVPLVTRELKDGNKFRLAGPCYLRGYLDKDAQDKVFQHGEF